MFTSGVGGRRGAEGDDQLVTHSCLYFLGEERMTLRFKHRTLYVKIIWHWVKFKAAV